MITAESRAAIRAANLKAEEEITQEMLTINPGESKMIRGVLVNRRTDVPTCFECGDSLGSARGLAMIVHVRSERA